MERTAEGLGKMEVWKLVLLTFFTGGIYSAVWFLRRLGAINGLSSPVKLNQGVFGFIIAGCASNIGMALFLVLFSGRIGPQTSANLSTASDILSLLVEVTVLLQTFKVRKVFMDHFMEKEKREISFSWAGTFFFSIFYLQYKINRL
ncbi:MAG: DUF4234 domain-containing protein [Deltaproteobacteria bacterium]|nr:DUF4234 domain-containing protein [Deltaproteobacteria bacterium]